MRENYNEAFDLWLKKNFDYILQRWMELIRIPSICGEGEDDAPFGINCKDALLKSVSYFSGSGFDTSISEKDGYALVYYGNGEKSIGLFAHSDVVPASDGWIYTTPFEPIVKDGALIGRGAEDNKSGIMATLCILEFLKDNNISLKNKLEVFIGSDEECGMKDLIAYLENHKEPDLSFVPDADYPCSVGEKGILHFALVSNKKFTDIVDFSGGEAYNIVLDKCTVKIKYSDALFSELKSKISVRKEFSLAVENNIIILNSTGIAKHASIPEGSVNAAYLCAKLLCECEYLNKDDRKIMNNAAVALSCYYGNGIGINHSDPAFGKTTAVNGMVYNIDNKLHLSFDVRYGDTLLPQTLEDVIEAEARKLSFRIVDINNRPGFLIDKSSKIPDILENIFYEITGKKKKRILMSGGTYARKLKNAFSVGTFYIPENKRESVLKMPHGHGGPHQCDEMIDIDGFFTSVKILLNYILACDDIL